VGIGSVKGNVGHTLRAAMAAGVAKAALALHNRVLPPQLPSENPIESLSNLGSSVYLLNEARPWITGDSSNPRRAAVLGANFDSAERVGMSADRGGRSAVIVLEEEPEDRL
jgi:acyl transferase domain-containing protein